MPRKTLALISGLVLVTVILFVVALRAGQQQQQPVKPQNETNTAVKAEPTIPAHTVLTVGPNPLEVGQGQLGTAQISVDTSDNNVTAIQLEMGYDPNLLSNVKIVPGPLFKNPAVLIDKNDPVKGRYTYAFGITPSGQPITGKGVIATVTFTPKAGSAGKQTQLGLLPTTLVTARGIADSVMKTSSGTVVSITASGTNTTGNINVQTAPLAPQTSSSAR